jgi:hypothetical protein
MATSTRLRGKTGFHLSFKVGAAAAVILGDDVKSWELTSDEADDSDLTFYEAAQGLTAEYTLALTAITSFDALSLWSFLWSNPGVDIAVVVGPHGNAVASATKPHFSFLANTGRKPGLANEARTSNEGSEFEHELLVVGDVTKIVA